MTRISRYIDDPPQILLWDIDVVVLFLMFFGIGIVTRNLTVLMGIGLLISYFLAKVKKNRSEGFLMHAAYLVCGAPAAGLYEKPSEGIHGIGGK